MDRRLDAILEELTDGEPLAPHARDELKLLVYEVRSGIPAGALGAEARRIGSAIRRAARRSTSSGRPPRTPASGPGAGWIARRCGCRTRPGSSSCFAADMGQDDAFALAEAMNRRAPMAVRANTGAYRARRPGAAAGGRAGRVAPDAAVAGRARSSTRASTRSRCTAFQDGLFEVMDEGSQLVAELVAPPPGGARRRRLRRRGRQDPGDRRPARRQGADPGARHRRQEARGAAPPRPARRAHQPRGAVRSDQSGKPIGQGAALRPGGFDRVLVDAPCSGLGTLRRNPEARWRLTPRRGRGVPGAAAGAAGRLRAAVRRGRPARLRDLHRGRASRTTPSSTGSWPSATISSRCR